MSIEFETRVLMRLEKNVPNHYKLRLISKVTVQSVTVLVTGTNNVITKLIILSA